VLADAGPWTLGWEFVLAGVTLLLALFTGWLAWVTRRLARTTALEVQSQSRPILVPVYGTFRVTQPDSGREFAVELGIRNIGAGPALRVVMQIGHRMNCSSTHAVLAPGEEVERRAVANLDYYYEVGQSHREITPLRFQYEDMAARVFTTEVGWSAWQGMSFKGDASKQVLFTDITLREPTTRDATDRFEIPLGTDPLAAGRRRFVESLPSRLKSARYDLFPSPGANAPPLPTRVRSAWKRVRHQRQQTISQRLRWATRAYRAARDKPVPHGAIRWTGLSPLYRVARGWRYAIRTYRNIR